MKTTISMKNVRGKKTLELLGLIANGIGEFGAVFEGLIRAGYGASSSKIRHEIDRVRHFDKSSNYLKSDELLEKERFYKMMYKLERDGLIEKTKRGRKSFAIITARGKQVLSAMKNRSDESRKLPVPRYTTTEIKNFIIVVFDIPETERRKRAWLRSALKNLGFFLIQKSVWLGKRKVPRLFINDLRRLKLTRFVEIFEITKSGSLERVS